MAGYRNRTGKPSAALWLLVVLADAAWTVSSGTVALLGTLAVLLMVAAGILAARMMGPARSNQRSWRM